MPTFPKYELKNGEILKDGHTMYPLDIVKDLNAGSKAREENDKHKRNRLARRRYGYA